MHWTAVVDTGVPVVHVDLGTLVVGLEVDGVTQAIIPTVTCPR